MAPAAPHLCDLRGGRGAQSLRGNGLCVKQHPYVLIGLKISRYFLISRKPDMLNTIENAKKKILCKMTELLPDLSGFICNSLGLCVQQRTLLGGGFADRGVGHIRNSKCLHYRGLKTTTT